MVLCTALLLITALAQVRGDRDAKMRQQIEEMKSQVKLYMHRDSAEFFAGLVGDKVHSMHAFRVLVHPKSTQCYYQEARKRATIDFEFECLSSPSFRSSAKISAFASLYEDQDGKAIKSVNVKRRGSLSITAEKQGTYAFCLDNTDAKELVYVQLLLEIWRMDELPKFHLQNQFGNDSMYHVYDGLFHISTAVSTMRSAVTHTRSLLKYDYLTRMSNLSMVNNFSVVSVILIITVCFVQLHVVKKMFGDTTRPGRV